MAGSCGRNCHRTQKRKLQSLSNERLTAAFESLDEASAKLLIRTLVEKMESVIGVSYKSEIFLHESCLYSDLLEKIIEAGIVPL